MDIKVMVLPYRGPRKSERTFPPTIGSIFNLGRKQASLRKYGVVGKSKSKAG